MKIKFIISIMALIIGCGMALYTSAKKNQNRRERVAKECDLYKKNLGNKIEILKEKARLDGAGLDVDLSQKEPGGREALEISSFRLDQNQVSCQVEVVSGFISSVH